MSMNRRTFLCFVYFFSIHLLMEHSSDARITLSLNIYEYLYISIKHSSDARITLSIYVYNWKTVLKLGLLLPYTSLN
jgi:hypothetical protein